MTYSERLIGTPLNDSKDAKAICGILDWLGKTGVTKMPSHRDWSLMLGLGTTGSSRARKVLMEMERVGIIERHSGTGRKTDSVAIPLNGSTPSDKRADFERRKATFKRRVIDELRIYVKDNDWSDVESFFNYWSEDIGEKDLNGVGDYLMLFENEERTLKLKGRTFTLRSRYVGWLKNKAKHAPPPSPDKVFKTDQELMEEDQKRREANAQIHKEGQAYLQEKQAFLDRGGSMEEWNEIVKEKYRNSKINGK